MKKGKSRNSVRSIAKATPAARNSISASSATPHHAAASGAYSMKTGNQMRCSKGKNSNALGGPPR